MSFIGATGLDEVQEQFDTLQEQIDANADYINNLVGIPDPTHTAIFGINILNPGLFGLVERAEVNIASLQTAEEGLGTDLSALTTQVETIETQITGIQGEISTIQGEITGIEGEISLIQFTELPAIVSSIAVAAGVAGDALGKANKSLGIWDEDGNNTYNMKSGNVAIGILPKGTLLNNKLEVNGSINIPTNSKYKINNVPLSYSDLAGTPPVSSKWTNATDVVTNIYYSTGNVGIGVTSAINNKLEVNGSINIPTGSKYKINNVDLSYNDLTNKLTAGTNISIVNNVINNTYSLPTATTSVLGGVKVDGSTITINGSGVISGANTYVLPTASTTILGGVKVDNSTITITNGVISAAAATPQVNSDWTQTNTSLKSFILNKPTAGNNISFANNTITNTITGSTSQNIIGLNANQLIIVDKPNSEKIEDTFIPLTSLNEPILTQNVIVSDAYYPRIPATNSATWVDNGYTMNVKVSDAVLATQYIYYIFNHIITSQDHYHSQQSYTGTGNTYTGATRFKTFAGIAIGVDYGRSIYPERMRIAPRPLQAGFSGNDFINGAPKAFKIFASDDAACWNDNNHSSWTQIHDQTTGLTYTNEQYTIVNLTSNLPKYRYYTMVVLSTIGNYAGGYMMIAEWNMGGDEKIVAIPEGTPTITHKTLNFAYNTGNITNQFTISVSSGTLVSINNQTSQYLSGTYTITLGATQSSVLAGAGGIGSGTDPYPLQNGSTIAFKYSMTQRIQTSVFYKKDGLIKYVPASGINPSTGTWQIIDVDSQLLSQFAGNLDWSRIASQPALSALSGDLEWSRILSKPALSALSGNLDWSRIASQPALSALSGNLDWGRINIIGVYMPSDRWITCANGNQRLYLANGATTYIKGGSGTPILFRNGSDQDLMLINSTGDIEFKDNNGQTNANLSRYGDWSCWLVSYSGSGMDNVGITNVSTSEGTFQYRKLRALHSTFTGYHRCYVDDELCNDDNIDIFKNEYIGRIVISTGKIKTDLTIKREPIPENDEPIPENEEPITENEEPIIKEKEHDNECEWKTLINKEGITIEDALPIVQLSRVRKDKRIYGVLGDPKRSSNNKGRIIVNGCGEGAICVANTNGNIENGDYIQTSDLLGYGEKQDDDIHRNYTIAKAVMDCNFELDNPNYECKELSSGVRVAMIACVYKAS